MSGTADAGVGGAVHHESASSDPGVQSEPVLEQNVATLQEKLDGIAAQTRVDHGDEPLERYEEVIRQRVTQSEIPMSDDEIRALALRARGAVPGENGEAGGRESGGAGA